MPPSRSHNGRSPLVNQRHQITAFFPKSTSPKPNPSKREIPNSDPNPNPNPNPNLDLLSPTTPSPLRSKPKKLLLVIGQTPSPPLPVNPPARLSTVMKKKRVQVDWPLCKESCDAEEEELDLENEEKIECKPEKKFKRLRRGYSAIKPVVTEETKED